jgi:hypothetical protein
MVAAAIVSGLVLVAAGLGATGRVVAAHVQATAAADAAALAAAPLTFLPGDPVEEASRFASLNGAHVVRCACEEDTALRKRTVTVEVAARVELPLVGMRTVRARAAAEFDPVSLVGG